MATPNVSATLTFVKRYPIVLCGFSLFFMPSVHRLLLYFTPLLLSTAIFIVAMMSWGPSASSERGKRRGKRKEGDEWSFNGIDEEDEAEDEDMEELHKLQEEIPQKGKLSKDMQPEHIPEMLGKGILQQEEVSQYGNPSNVNDKQHEVEEKPSNAEPDPDLKPEAEQQEPVAEERNRVGTASNEAVSSQLGCQLAEPDPDLQRDYVGIASVCAAAVQHAEPDPDLHAEQDAVSDFIQNLPAAQHEYAAPASNHHFLPSSAHDHHHAEPAELNHDEQAPGPQDHHHAEPDPDLHGESAEPAQLNQDQHASDPQDHQHAEPDPDLHGESGGADKQAGSNEDVEGDLHAAVSQLRPHDMELAKAAVERLEASLGISGSSSFSHQPAPADHLQALHAAA